MATKIGFKLQDKAIIPDSSALFDLSNILLNQEKDRETQRQAWRDEQDALRKTQNELTPTANQNANQFFGKFSQGIMDESIRLQKQLETGQINSSDYSAQWSNLNQTNEQMIAAQTSYQERAQQIADDVASGKSSAVNTADLNHFNKVFQPGAMEVEPDGRGGLKLFNKETNDVVSPSYLSNLTNGNLPKYDYKTVASTLAKQFGERGITDAAGNSIKGVYANMDTTKLDELMLKEAQALLAGSQAPTVSILVDGMGYDVVYNEDELKPGSVYRKPDGTFAFAKGDKVKAEVFMRDALKNALPLETKKAKTIIPDTKTPTQIDADNKAILSYGIAYEVVLGGPNGESTKNQIVVNNKEISNLYENNDAFVIQYEDPAKEDAIVVKIKDAEGNYNLEDTAVSLYEAVNPKGTVTDARTAKENYFKRNEKGIKSEDETLLGERKAFTPLNSTQVQTTRQKRAKSVIYIADEINKITPDAEVVDKVNTIIKDITPLPGTQKIMNQIKISSDNNFSEKDQLTIEVPKELLPFVKKITGVKYNKGNKISFDYDDDKDNVTLTSVVDGILEGMYSIYNETNTSPKLKKQTGKPPLFKEWQKENPDGTFTDYKKLYKS